MMTEKHVPGSVLDALRNHDHILLAAHIHPDGDAMGSCLAMARALQALGRDVLIYNADGFPSFLDFLERPCPVLTDLSQLPGDPQLAIILDCGDRARAGEDIQSLLDRVPSVCIDHHMANPGFGSVASWVDPEMSSTGEMVAMITRSLGIPLQGALAEALYVALSTDTGNFSYGNTTPGALEIASEMAARGLDIASLRDHLENNWTETKLRLWGRLMQETRILDDGRLAAVLITGSLLKEYGATREDTEGFVEQLRRLHGVRVALLLREDERNGIVQTKASIRSSGKDNVRDVAAQFGGGGHRNAAGATLSMNAESAFLAMLPALRSVWHDNQ